MLKTGFWKESRIVLFTTHYTIMKNNRFTLLIVVLTGLLSACNFQNNTNMDAPQAERIEEKLIIHGDTRIDFYYWLNQRENPDVISYLEEENKYIREVMKPTEELRNELFKEMRSRIKEDDSSAPYFDNGYYYYSRYETGGEYPLYCRKQGSLDAQEEIILNVPEMAKDYSFYSIGGYSVSPDNDFVAFAVDTMGRRQYKILVKNLETGELFQTDHENAAGSLVWANDNKTIFFGTVDQETLRYDRIMKYDFTTGETNEVYYEKDETFYYMGVGKTKDSKYLTISVNSTLSNETLILDANKPDGEFKPFQKRQNDLLYDIYSYSDGFYILTNYDAMNFRLMKTSEDNTSMENWKEVVGHREDVLLEDIEVFKDYLVLQERSKGLNRLRIMHDGKDNYINFEEDAYTASIHINRQMDTNILRYSYTSLTTPYKIIDYNMDDKSKVTVWQQKVPGGFSSEEYETHRIYAEARDGVQIPVSLVYKKGTELDGNNPLLQYGYGSYGISMNPRFNSSIISLLDRGFIYAIAHIRGGQEMGRQWYEDGKLLNKMNTFTDFIDVSLFLIDSDYTNPEKLFASGGSAGGLLMGAVANLRPDLYNGIIASVPFVDVVTTMLDESIPLTTSEYDEWGNPNEKEYYEYMLSYSPYDQVEEQDYPNMLILTGLHDSQVQYWEPAKWTAKLRDFNTSNSLILMKTNMEAGHGGASGRFESLSERSWQYAFLLFLLDEV